MLNRRWLCFGSFRSLTSLALLGAPLLAEPVLAAPSAGAEKPALPAGTVPASVAVVVPAAQAPAPKVRTLLIDDVSGLGLTAAERSGVRKLLADWARSRGFGVIEPEQVESVMERARSGRNVRTGEACGRPLSPFAATQRYYRELGVDAELRASVVCENKGGRCKLSLSAYDGFNFDGDALFDETAPYDARRAYTQALPAALGKLSRSKEAEGGALGLLGGMEGGRVKAQPERFTFIARPAFATDQHRDQAFAKALGFPAGPAPGRACFDEHGGTVEVLVSADAEGAIGQCETLGDDDDASRCACAALTKFARLAAPVRGTRARVELSLQPADVTTPWNGLVSASVHTHIDRYKDRRGELRFRPLVSDLSVEGYEPPSSHALAVCFADVKERAQLPARITLGFDEKGKVGRVEVRERGKQLYTPQQRSCVEQAFRATQAPCPAVPVSQATVDLSVAVRPVGEPMGKLLE